MATKPEAQMKKVAERGEAAVSGSAGSKGPRSRPRQRTRKRRAEERWARAEARAVQKALGAGGAAMAMGGA